MGNIIRRVLPRRPSLEKANTADALVVPSGVSEDAIRKIVDGFMKNKKINQRFIPDSIERQLYQNMIVLLMALLEESLKTARIQFLGHELTVHIGTPGVQDVTSNVTSDVASDVASDVVSDVASDVASDVVTSVKTK